MTEDYRTIAQAIADDIDAGVLLPGDQLPPQRIFAWQRGIAASTASRVYAELRRRGLIVGEVGRGSFVRSAPLSQEPVLAEPPPLPINLETNYPILPEQHAILAPVLRQVTATPDTLLRALRETSVRGSLTMRDCFAHGLVWQGWRAPAAHLLFAGNGRQALAATFSALAKPGERIGCEAMTYPMAKVIAAKLGLVVVPIAMDEHGVIPSAIAEAHRAAPLRAVYLQPTLHNPLGMTMPAERRRQLAALLQDLGGPIAVEDAAYAFLDAEAPPPLASFAPDHTVFIDAMSKRLGPGLTLGLIAPAQHFAEPIAQALMAGAWGPSGLALEVFQRLVRDGRIDVLEQMKRGDGETRQALAREALQGLCWRAHRASYHLMVDLPTGVRAETVVARARTQGIAITAGAAFAATPAHAANAVRIGLANLALEQIGPVLRALRGLMSCA
jgi:DNA-binding transcriptional MocR family regulator